MPPARPAGRAFSPLDEELGLLPGRFSPSLQESAVRLGTWLPFAPAARMVAHFTHTEVSPATVRRTTEGAGAAYVGVQTAQVEALEQHWPVTPPGRPRLQVSVDGAMVPLRGKGEWAEAKTLAIGEVGAPQWDPKHAEWQVHAEHPSYFSRLTDHATFTRLALAESQRRGVDRAGVVCGVVDGAEWCQHFLDRHRPDAVRILDFSHALEHLATAAKACFGPGTAKLSQWLDAQAHALKHDQPTAVLAALRALPVAQASDPAAAIEQRDETLGYLEKRQDHITYRVFQAQGYPIGSGMVESANKLVVEARLKGAGMHWARAHVDPLLALRTIACSDRWEEAWPQLTTHRRAAERQRQTARRQARQPSLPVAAAELAPDTAPVAAARASVSSARRGPPKMVDGRPTAAHPWSRPLRPERQAAAAPGAKL